jgi:toxin ParE1/3/4
LKRYTVRFTPEADRQRDALEQHIAEAAGRAVARNFVRSVLDRCHALAVFPFRSTPRDDLRPGLRVTVLRRRTQIFYTVESDEVIILAIFHGGQDYEAAFRG